MTRLVSICDLSAKGLHRFYSKILRMNGHKVSPGERAILDDLVTYLLLAEIYVSKHGMGSILNPGKLRLSMPRCKEKERIEHQVLLELAYHASCFMHALGDENAQSMVYAAFMMGRHAPERAEAVTRVLDTAQRSHRVKQSGKHPGKTTTAEVLVAMANYAGDHAQVRDQLVISQSTLTRHLRGTEWQRGRGRPSAK